MADSVHGRKGYDKRNVRKHLYRNVKEFICFNLRLFKFYKINCLCHINEIVPLFVYTMSIAAQDDMKNLSLDFTIGTPISHHVGFRPHFYIFVNLMVSGVN